MDVDRIRECLAKIGVRLPPSYRKDVITALNYLQDHGENYKDLVNSEERLSQTLPSELKRPNGHLNWNVRSQLQKTCTDFDLFRIAPIPTDCDRATAIDRCVHYFFPAGEFALSPGPVLYHTYRGKTFTYNTVESIKCLARTLKTIRTENGTPVGLYQMAYLFRNFPDVYRFYLQRISEVERLGSPRLRFGDEFRKFNEDILAFTA